MNSENHEIREILEVLVEIRKQVTHGFAKLEAQIAEIQKQSAQEFTGVHKDLNLLRTRLIVPSLIKIKEVHSKIA
jgi:hypothetical protein